jgi:DNA primase
VNVAVLPPGEDPDTFIRRHGARAYGERLRQSQPYLEYLLDRSAAGQNLNTDEGRVKFVTEMLPVAARIPDLAARDRFADRLAHKARITEDVIRAEIRKAASQGQTRLTPRELPSFGRMTKAEKGLIWMLVHDPQPALTALASLVDEDFIGLSAQGVLDLARKLNEDRGFSPSEFFQRLSSVESQLVAGIAAEPRDAVWALDYCLQQLRRARLERERQALQQEIDRLQEANGADAEHLSALLTRKYELIRQIDVLI